MREKELDKLLDDLKEIITKTYKVPTEEEINKKLDEALKEPCLIKIENTKQGTRMNIEGGRLTLLLILAGAEKGILKQLDCSEEEYKFIKEIVGMNDENE